MGERLIVLECLGDDQMHTVARSDGTLLPEFQTSDCGVLALCLLCFIAAYHTHVTTLPVGPPAASGEPVGTTPLRKPPN